MPGHGLTIEDVERVGRMLMPSFGEAVGDKIDELEGKLDRKYEQRFAAIEQELARQKGLLGKVAAVYGVIATVVVLAWGMISDWVKGKLSRK